MILVKKTKFQVETGILNKKVQISAKIKLSTELVYLTQS